VLRRPFEFALNAAIGMMDQATGRCAEIAIRKAANGRLARK
jgi:hypothetical protein